MVQIIEENKKKTFAQKLNAGLGPALQQGAQLMQQHQAKQELQGKMTKENKAVKERFGIDLSDISDPKLREQLVGKSFDREKPLNALQQSQINLNEEKGKSLKGQEELFASMFGQKEQPQNQEANQQELPGIGKPQGKQNNSSQSQEMDSQNPQTWSESALKKIASFAGQPGKQGIIGNMAKIELDRRNEDIKSGNLKNIEERKYHTEFSKKAEEEAESIRNNLSKKEYSLDLSRNAVESGEIGAFSLSNLAQRLHIPEWQTMKGAQLETAIKENLLSNMSRVSAKGQNIWFEQRLNSMMAQIGKSKEANLAAQEILEGETAMDKSYLENFDRLAQEDMDKYGFVKKDISKRAHSASKHADKEIFDRTNYRLKELEESEKGLTSMRKDVGKDVTKGAVLTLAMAKLYKEKFGDKALKVAEKNNYYIPTLEEFRIYQQRPQEFRQELIE